MGEYSIDFYSELEKSSAASAKVLVPILIERFEPSTVVDFGCGSGAFIRRFLANNIEDVVGIEGEWILEVRELASERWLKVYDLKSPIDLGRRFDMALCLEVAEHLTSDYARGLVQTLVNASDRIVFSAAIPGQDGTDHINLQYPEYWANLFREHDYYLEWDPRPSIWNKRDLASWYQQNLLIYHKTNKTGQTFICPERRFHPEIFPEHGNLPFRLRFLARRFLRRIKSELNSGSLDVE